jgi:hypothetical protein
MFKDDRLVGASSIKLTEFGGVDEERYTEYRKHDQKSRACSK